MNVFYIDTDKDGFYLCTYDCCDILDSARCFIRKYGYIKTPHSDTLLIGVI